MIQLLLLLYGSRIVRRNWWVVLGFGLLWLSLGVFFLIDAVIEEIRIPPIYFTLPLLIDGTISLMAATSANNTARKLRLAKAVVFLCIVLLIIGAPRHSGFIIGLIAGTFLIADACWRGASAYVVRFEGWQYSLCYAIVEFVSGLWSYVPWPTYWEGEIGEDVGTLIVLTAVSICGLALRIRRLPPDAPILSILGRGWPKKDESEASETGADASPRHGEEEEVIVHVWTPTEALVSVNRGISRYVAALDRNGVISTGHAALEVPPDIYISHYPAVEIERDQTQFAKVLRATAENDVPGIFQPSYTEESAAWCPSTMRVHLHGLNTAAVRDFWKSYRKDTTYNLTNRNCSSVVAKALDAGLDGLFERQPHSSFLLIRLLVLPELWVAGFMRHRAAAMAWTPGFILDYARALSHVLALFAPKTRQGKQP